MSIISTEEFSRYINAKQTDEQSLILKETILDSAQNIVEFYLGYPVKRMSIDEEVHFIQLDTAYLPTDALPISDLGYVEVDGVEVDVDEFIIYKDMLYYEKGFKQGQKVKISYTSGWSSRNLPSIIKLTIMRIGALLWAEQNGNIGVTSVSSGMGDSRVFTNYTNYNRYLSEIANYRVLRF